MMILTETLFVGVDSIPDYQRHEMAVSRPKARSEGIVYWLILVMSIEPACSGPCPQQRLCGSS